MLRGYIATATVALALAGCEATDEFQVRSGDEVAAERRINNLQDALGDEDYEAACDELAPEGFANIVTGRTGREASLARCPEVLELTITVNKVDFSGVEPVKITEVREDGNELVAEAETGENWRLTRDYAITAVPR